MTAWFISIGANSIIGPKLIALDNVWKADQPALGNRAFTFQRVKEKWGFTSRKK
jgi:hypothetical protein